MIWTGSASSTCVTRPSDEQAKKRRDEREAARERALRDELKAQDTPQPDLARRYKQQEKERAKRQEQAVEERERQAIERELAYGSGFHV